MTRRKPESRLDVSELPTLAKALDQASGRGTALLATAWLDDALDQFVRSRCLDDAAVLRFLFENRGPLESFYSRIQVAYAFGLIGADVRNELNLIREIRNEFAHIRDPLSFSDPSIEARCKSLQVPSMVEREVNDTLATVQDRFLVSCLLLATLFMAGASPPRRPAGMEPVTIASVAGASHSIEVFAMALALIRKIRDAVRKQDDA
jgi:Mannitol repressor.